VEVSALKMPKGRTPYMPGDLDYFVLCCVLLKRFSREGTQLKKGLPSYIMLLQE
jgi:hypothetical protein